MSGGYFGYAQYEIKSVADQLREVIDDKEYKEKFSENTVDDFMVCYKYLRYASAYLHRIDLLLSGDTGEDSFYQGLDKAIDEVVRDDTYLDIANLLDLEKAYVKNVGLDNSIKSYLTEKSKMENNAWDPKTELPPVGTIVEYALDDSFGVLKGDRLKCLAHMQCGDDAVAVYWNFNGEVALDFGICNTFDENYVRPIKTDRELFIDECAECLGISNTQATKDWLGQIYSAILSGRITGVKIDKNAD